MRILVLLLMSFVISLAGAQGMSCAESLSIIVIGDSIVKGDTFFGRDSGGEINTIQGGWVTRLADLLTEDCPEAFEVLNAGRGQDTTYGLLQRVSELQDADPDVVLVGIGSVDAMFWDRAFDIAKTAEEYSTIMNDILDAIVRDLPEADVYLIGFATPVWHQVTDDSLLFEVAKGQSQASFDAQYTAFNDALEALAVEADHPFIDVAAIFPSELDQRSGLLADGLHPNDTGYTLIAEAVYEAMLVRP